MQSACFSPGTQVHKSSSFGFALGVHDGGPPFVRHVRHSPSVTSPASAECSATHATSFGPMMNEHVPSICSISSLQPQAAGAASTSGFEASRGGRVGFGRSPGEAVVAGSGSVATTAPPQATISAPGIPNMTR